MRNASRRDFLVSAGSFALAAGAPARAAMSPDDKFDLLIKAETYSIRANRCAVRGISASAMV
jgi:hypothetical protein